MKEIRILSGPLAGSSARVLEELGDGRLEVEVEIFGRRRALTLEPDEYESDRPSAEALRRDLAKRLSRLEERKADAWWDRRLAQEPSSDPAEEWREFSARRQSWAVAAEGLSQVALPEGLTRPEFEAWLEREVPFPPAHPLIEAARREGRLTTLGNPRLSTSEWAEVDAAARARLARRRAARAAAFREEHELPGPAELAARAEAALSEVAPRRELWQERFRASHGLVLPEHAFRCWAWFQSLSSWEGSLLERLGISPGGIFDRFRETDPELHEGRDHRQHGRFYRSPPELLHALWGDTDGLHWGLWYDDPAQEPPFVAGFYARDGGGVFASARTLLGVVRARITQRFTSLADDKGLSEDERVEERCALDVLRASLDAFEEAGPEPDLSGRLRTLDEVGAWVPEADPEQVAAALAGGLDDLERKLSEARAELEAGRPALALVLGRDLQWCSGSDPAREALAGELLSAAYRALGRDALAEVAKLHARTRHQPSVGAYRS